MVKYILSSYRLIVLNDLDGKIGRRPYFEASFMGEVGMGNVNNSEKRLLDMCMW